MSKVYFTKEDNIGKLYSKIYSKLSKEKIAIKLHFGEEGCETYLSPELVNELLKNINQDYVLTDCNVLYKGSRTETKDHLKTAKRHGFPDPIKIGDEDGEIEIPVNLKHFEKVKVGKIIEDYKNIIVLSHFKGHSSAGFGGAFKNLGMGFGSRAGKLAMHSKISPSINQEKCIQCGKCIENCPADAIEKINGENKINQDKCIGCAKCIAVCPEKAVRIPFGSASKKELQERFVEYCYGIAKNRNLIYFNSLKKITEGCDCMGSKQKPIMDDIGILASTDPVSLDQACLDLVKNKMGENPFKKRNGVSGERQIEYAEKLGMGERKYEIENID